jgi:hypothetical protein
LANFELREEKKERGVIDTAYLELGEGRDEEGVRDVAHAGENDALQLGVLGLQEPSNNWLTKEQNHEVEISATYICFLYIYCIQRFLPTHVLKIPYRMP